jgi:predicted nucleic acid-binding protein
LYFDSSALVKLVRHEPESDALRRFLAVHRDDGLVTSTLAQVEVVRSVLGGGAAAVARARDELAGFDQLPMEIALLEAAATLAPTMLVRSLDAIHLASAQLVGAELRAVVTYDQRMADAATALALPVAAPA